MKATRYLIILISFMMACKPCIKDKDEIVYGKYCSNANKNDIIILHKDQTYEHIVKKYNYYAVGEWHHYDCTIMFKHFCRVVDYTELEPSLQDTSKCGSVGFTLLKNEFRSPVHDYGYTYKK